jgi:hypothetical protein
VRNKASELCWDSGGGSDGDSSGLGRENTSMEFSMPWLMTRKWVGVRAVTRRAAIVGFSKRYYTLYNSIAMITGLTKLHGGRWYSVWLGMCSKRGSSLLVATRKSPVMEILSKYRDGI